VGAGPISEIRIAATIEHQPGRSSASYGAGETKMSDFGLGYEPVIRLGFFAGIFAAVAMGELVAPRRTLTTSKGVRWVGNLGIVAINTLAVRLIFPAGAVGMALWVSQRGWGFCNIFPVP